MATVISLAPPTSLHTPRTSLAAHGHAPARVRAMRLLGMGGIFAATAGLALPLDLPLARWTAHVVASDHLPSDLIRLVELSEAFSHGATAALIILTACLLDQRRWRVLPRLAISAFGAGLVADAMKHLVARQRPVYLNLNEPIERTFLVAFPDWNAAYLSELGLRYNSHLRSFPSGHTATAVGLAIGLAVLYPRGKWVFFAFAVLATTQRLWSQYHYLGDCLAGAAIACTLCAAAEFWVLSRWERPAPCPPV